MKCLNRNKRTFYYALFQGTEPILDENGNDTLEKRLLYAEPETMQANISAASGYAQTELFGNLDSYDRVIVTDWLECPIDEHTVLFVDKEPEHNTDGDLMYDYIVKRVAKSLNSVSIAIRKVEIG